MQENSADMRPGGMPPAAPGMDRALSGALANAGVVVIYQDMDMRVIWSRNVPDHWHEGPIAGLTDAGFLPRETAESLTDLKRQVVEAGRGRRVEFEMVADHAHWYDMWLDVDYDDAGQPAGIISTIIDITERKHHERTLRALLREVSHRSKNLLAIILSVATQTGRYTDSVEGFLDRFRGRVQSLASSQDLVTSSDWRGATLHELIESQAGRYCDDIHASIHHAGIDPFLTPNAALHVGLAIHELVVNSVAHGALSRPGGHIDLSARIEDGEGARIMVVTWAEDIGHVEEPGRKRFGSMALERVVPASLDGQATLIRQGRSLIYRLLVPGQNFTWPVIAPTAETAKK